MTTPPHCRRALGVPAILLSAALTVALAATAQPHAAHASSPAVSSREDDPAETPEVPTTEQPPAPGQPIGTSSFQLASINLLGAGHTDGPGGRKGFADSDVRLRITEKVMDRRSVDVVGFQEMHKPQVRQWLNEQSSSWGLFPADTMHESAGHNSLSWRKDTFARLKAKTIKIPYFKGNEIHMPYMKLRHRPTGQAAWFINVHNPADVRGPAQKWRNEAVRRQAALIRNLKAAEPGVPVFLTGDMNDREKFLCPMLASAPVAAANGGFASGSQCTPPPNMKVDWIVGTTDTTFTGYLALRDAQVAQASDHPFIFANVNIPTPQMRASPIRRVVVLAVNGLRGPAVRKVGAAGAPYLHKLLSRGTGTLEARTTMENTRSMPNLVSLLTGRRVYAKAGGHGVRGNYDDGRTIHHSAGRYVSSVFDMAHNNGLRTAFYTSKSRSAKVLRSWSAGHGGRDPYGKDHGADKIDWGGVYQNDLKVMRATKGRLASAPAHLTVAEFGQLDWVGSKYGYASKRYYAALKSVDRLVKKIDKTVQRSAKTSGKTLVIVTGLSGGANRSNADPDRPANFRVPIIVSGPGVATAREIYSMNPAFTYPGVARASYGAEPILVPSLTNLILAPLRLPPLPGSQFNIGQNLSPWTP